MLNVTGSITLLSALQLTGEEVGESGNAAGSPCYCLATMI